MKAIQFQAGRAITDPEVAKLVELEQPVAEGFDLLVEVEAVAINPVDTKVRPKADEEHKVLGFDAAGKVVGVGERVMGYSIGDEVFYAGDIGRAGSNSEYQLVDSRIVGVRPKSISAGEAAALPLTALTAWEALFDRIGVDPDGGDEGISLLIIGGAGGVGSIGIQLAKMAGLRVIATASREESANWCRELGADEVIDHSEPLRPQMEELGLSHVDVIANFNNTSAYWEVMGDLIAPQGRISIIVSPTAPLDLAGDYKLKSATVSWEFMFTRPMYVTGDIDKQRRILNEIARRVDTKELRTTVGSDGGAITVENLVQAHKDIESGSTIGKIVLCGWE